MMRKAIFISIVAVLLTIAVACSKSTTQSPQLIVDIPAGFSGNFSLEMGIKTAPPLQKYGDSYLVVVPRSGKLETATVLEHPKVDFKNATDGSIWGYSESKFTTGDGISVGGKIEFFVGTRKDFDAQEQKKNHSGRFSSLGDSSMPGV
jgi:hypothetical protein